MKKQRYPDGSEVHVGDRVFHNGQPGVIVFVADHDEYSPEYPQEEWRNIKSGFMIVFENGARLLLDSPEYHFSKDREESLH